MTACLKRLRKNAGIKLLVAAVFLYASLPQTSVSQNVDATLLTQLAPPENQGDLVLYHRSKDWFLKCDYQAKQDIRRCELTTSPLGEHEETKKPYSLIIVTTNAGGPPLVVIRTPLNLHLTKGVSMNVDQRSIGKLSYRSCDRRGCTVPFSMTGATSKRMLQGTKVSFEFHDLSGETQTASFSLIGIASVLKVVEKFIKA